MNLSVHNYLNPPSDRTMFRYMQIDPFITARNSRLNHTDTFILMTTGMEIRTG